MRDYSQPGMKWFQTPYVRTAKFSLQFEFVQYKTDPGFRNKENE